MTSGPAAAVGPLESVDDRAVVAQGETAQAERGPQQVANEPLERGPVAPGRRDAGVDVDALGEGDERNLEGL